MQQPLGPGGGEGEASRNEIDPEPAAPGPEQIEPEPEQHLQEELGQDPVEQAVVEQIPEMIPEMIIPDEGNPEQEAREDVSREDDRVVIEEENLVLKNNPVLNHEVAQMNQ